jgi:hypothetical protein
MFALEYSWLGSTQGLDTMRFLGSQIRRPELALRVFDYSTWQSSSSSQLFPLPKLFSALALLDRGAWVGLCYRRANMPRIVGVGP